MAIPAPVCDKSHGDILRRFAFVVVVAASVACYSSSAAQAAADLKINHFAVGAVAAYSTCIPQPNGDDLCVDYRVFYGRAGETRDDVARDPAAAELEHYEAFIHPDGTADEFVAEIGFTTDVSGSFDRAHLTFARMNGATLDLFDIDPATGDLVPNGRTATLGPFAWTAASDVHVYGNDGPFGFGLPRHYVDQCATEVSNGHERFTAARVTGTINGVSVDSFGQSYLPWPGTGPADARGAVFDNRFTLVVASHAPDC